jgi:hypothetical protein
MKYWQKIGTIILMVGIFTSGLINYEISSHNVIQLEFAPKSELIQIINYSRLIDSVFYNFNNASFEENNVPSLRAFSDATSILYILQETFQIDKDEVIRNIRNTQGANGGIRYNLYSTDEYSFTIYYILNGLANLQIPYSSYINTTLYTDFLIQCYHNDSGGFSLKPNDPENLYSNWMIMTGLNRLNLTRYFNLTRNMEYLIENLNLKDSQNLFSAIASDYLIDFEICAFLKSESMVDSLISIIEETIDPFERFYSLMSLNLIGQQSKISNISRYVNKNVNDLNLELSGLRNLNKIYTILITIAILIGEMDVSDVLLLRSK